MELSSLRSQPDVVYLGRGGRSESWNADLQVRIVAMNEGLCGSGDPRSLGPSVFNILCYFRDVGLARTSHQFSPRGAVGVVRCGVFVG